MSTIEGNLDDDGLGITAGGAVQDFDLQDFVGTNSDLIEHIVLVTQAFHTLLSEDAGVQSLVSTRVFPARQPQKSEYPAIRWGRLDSGIAAVLNVEAGEWLMWDVFIVDCFAQGSGGYLAASNIHDAVLQCLHGYSGVVSDGGSPESTIQIQRIAFEKLDEFYRDELQQYATRSFYRVHSVRIQRS